MCETFFKRLCSITSVVLVLFSVSETVRIETLKGCPTTPELKIISPALEATHLISQKHHHLIIKDKVNITLECRSKKPIDLDFEGRLALDIFQVDAYRSSVSRSEECFSLNVTFSGDREATGMYRCWNIGDKEKSFDALYLYTNAAVPPFLLHGDGEEITVYARNQDEEVFLPCSVTNPEIPVALYRVTHQRFELLSLTEGEHLKYDPRQGFKVNLRKFPDPFGKYKCVAKSQNSVHDEVIISLKQQSQNHEKLVGKRNQPEIFENSFARGRDKQALVCSGNVGLELKSSSNCKTQIECRLVEKCMRGETTCPHSCKCSNSGQSCSKTLLKQFFNDPKKHLGEKCESTGKNENGGVLHCTSSKYLEGTSMTYFLGLQGHLVTNWRETERDEVLSMAAQFGIHVIYNVGEKITFKCVASKFVFAQGFKWMLKLENGDIIPANVTGIQNKITDSLIMEDARIHISQPEIKEIVCDAPVWNETEWVRSQLPIFVQDSVAPAFSESKNLTVYYHPNEKNQQLSCEALGFPPPDILWYRNGEEIRSELIFDSTRDNTTIAILKFPEVVESDHGSIYLCNASNPRGMALRTFTIHVRGSIWTIIFSVIGGVVFLCLIVFIVVVSVQLVRGGRKQIVNGYTFHFSDFDVEEFKLGNPEAVKHCNDVEEKAFYLPYDDDRYEIKEEHLDIEYDTILGQGEYGIVLKGTFCKDEDSFPVAVKTLKSHDMHQLKSLLSELKIMIYIGGHQNIVTLVGAVTSQLAQRKACVVVEYCALGNLETYIRERRQNFLDEFDSGNNVFGSRQNPALVPSYVRFNYAIKTTDLIKWAYEIATGMEYLTSRKIIHGDVALRNALLDANQTVKITDFGLSKQLYKRSGSYRKTQDVPLPWKWLAPESLQDRSFSVQSDVWSFGILLWELFSLADTPYMGIGYSLEFLQQLSNGYRLDKPRFSNVEIYSIMRDCWRQEATQRPIFSDLRQDFSRMLPDLVVETTTNEETAAQNAMNILLQGTAPSVPTYIEERQPLRI